MHMIQLLIDRCIIFVSLELLLFKYNSNIDRGRASPVWVDRGRGLLDFVVGSGVDEFAVDLCWLLMVWIGG